MGFQRYLLLICVAIIFTIGLVMVFDTSSADVLDRSLNKSTHYALFRQILYAILGSIVAMGVWFVGYQNLIKLAEPLLYFCSFLLLLVFIPGIGKAVNGAHRWIGIGMYTIQPSEFVKYAIPIYYIHYILSLQKSSLELLDFLKIMGVIAIPAVLIFLEPDTGTTGIVGLTMIMLLVLTRVKLKYWGFPMLAVALMGSVLAYHMPYVRNRIAVYLNPELDLRGWGHQPHQAKIAAGSGGFLGKGIGKSLQKLNYLPEAQNDYIAAIYAEEFGFLGILLLISLYMLIAYLGFHIALSAKDRGGSYLAASITFLICIQAFLNLGVVSGLLPSTGLNLPFFSQGGTSLMANIIGIAMLLNIAAGAEENKKMIHGEKMQVH